MKGEFNFTFAKLAEIAGFLQVNEAVDLLANVVLTISAELVDVQDHRRLWAEQYSSQVSDVLAVQKKIAEEIAENLRVRSGVAEKQQGPRLYTQSSEAYDAYARGHHLLLKRTTPTTEKSIEYFEQAIKLDPNYALAYAELSFAYWSIRGSRPSEEFLLKANEAAAKALELDDQLAEAYTTMGHVRSSYWDWTELRALSDAPLN